LEDGVAVRAVRPVALVVAMLLAVGSYQLSNTMIAPINPAIIASLHTSAGGVGLAQTLFFLTSAISAVIVTRVSDWTGRRRALIVSLGALVVAAVISAVAPGVAVYVVSRALAGLCGAVYAFCFLILYEVMPLRQFSRALAVIAAVKSGLGGVESVVGGAIADTLGWRGVFWFMAAFALVAIVVARLVIPEVPVHGRRAMDWPGSVLIGLGLTGVLVGLAQGGAWGWADARTLALLIGGVVLLALFPLAERRHANPLIAASRLASRMSWPLLLTNVLVLAGGLGATAFVVPLLSQAAVGYGMSATWSAVVFVMPVSAIGFLTAPLAGWLAPRVGWRRLLLVGLAATVAALVVAAAGAASPVLVFAMIVVLGGFYTGLVLTALDGLGVLLSPSESRGSLTGLNTAAFGVGASAGTAVAATVLTAASGGGPPTMGAFTAALWVAAGLAAVALAVAFLIPSRGDGTVEEPAAV
jgi:predicted MFS family arabinose efflux permease